MDRTSVSRAIVIERGGAVKNYEKKEEKKFKQINNNNVSIYIYIYNIFIYMYILLEFYLRSEKVDILNSSKHHLVIIILKKFTAILNFTEASPRTHAHHFHSEAVILLKNTTTPSPPLILHCGHHHLEFIIIPLLCRQSSC